jgi:hypothetical protein
LFVLTEKGNLFVFKIQERFKNSEGFDEHLSRPEIVGELDADHPVHVKDLSGIKMIATGTDHFLGLT